MACRFGFDGGKMSDLSWLIAFLLLILLTAVVVVPEIRERVAPLIRYVVVGAMALPLFLLFIAFVVFVMFFVSALQNY
jgi:hypothetical protein